MQVFTLLFVVRYPNLLIRVESSLIYKIRILHKMCILLQSNEQRCKTRKKIK